VSVLENCTISADHFDGGRSRKPLGPHLRSEKPLCRQFLGESEGGVLARIRLAPKRRTLLTGGRRKGLDFELAAADGCHPVVPCND
jgi:hypothetical protein